MKKSRNITVLPNHIVYDEIPSPVGMLTLIASNDHLHAVYWDIDREKIVLNPSLQNKDNHIIIQTKIQLNEYFEGKRKLFDLPLAMNGTSFQIQAWQQLQKIPYATTISYAQQAEKMGDKKKARAVGLANGRNPISIIVPCHRVIGSNGQLVGFAGGLDKKSFLLELEQKFKYY